VPSNLFDVGSIDADVGKLLVVEPVEFKAGHIA